MEIAFYVISILASLWLIISFLICLFWLFNLDLREDFFIKHRKVGFIIAVGGFLAIFLMITEGIRSFLGFLPDAWGSYDEEGEFHAVRDSISAFVGLLAAFTLARAYETTIQFHDAKQSLESQLELQRQEGRIHHITSSERHYLYNMYNQRLTKLRGKTNLSDEENTELFMLVGFLEELKNLMEN